MRWEYVTLLGSLGPCLNMNRAIFGPPEGYHEWLEQVRSSLVRNETEAAVFDVAARGWDYQYSRLSVPILPRLFAQVVGGDASSCVELAAMIGMMM